MRRPYYVIKQNPTVGALLCALSICLLAGCSGGSGGGSGHSRNRLVPAVEATQARYGSLPLIQRLSGVVRAKNQVELYPEISAVIAEVYVHNGELVKSGNPLLRMHDTEFREQLKQAEASHQIAIAQAKQAEAELARTRAELKRSTDLSEKDLISPTELEAVQTLAITAEAAAELARARVGQAAAAVDERKEELSRTVMRAPFDGTIGNRDAEVGMLVTPSTKLFMLGQLDSIQVEVVLSDIMLSYIQAGQRSEIFSQSMALGSHTASIARISPFLHPVTHSTIAQIDLANSEGALKPGMFVTVDIFYGESEQATLVPLSALWENPTTASVGVYVSSDSPIGEPVTVVEAPHHGALTGPLSFKFVPVEVLAMGRMTAGVKGIDQGDWIVTIGQELIGADSGQARVRPVTWERVEELQELQREDLLEEIMRRQQESPIDSSIGSAMPVGRKDAS